MVRLVRSPLAVMSLLLFELSPGCDSLKGPEGPAGQVLTGDLVGFAYMINEVGRQATDNSGVTVTAEGTNISAVTSPDGRWVLSNLTTGTYNIALAKTGYGTTKIVGFQFVGGGQAFFGTVLIGQIPGYSVGALAATVSSGNVNLNGSLTGTLPAAARGVRFFAGTSASVSSDPSTYLWTALQLVPSTTASFSYSIPGYVLALKGMSGGQTAYIIAYAENPSSVGAYPDLSTGRIWFPNLNLATSGEVAVVVP